MPDNPEIAVGFATPTEAEEVAVLQHRSHTISFREFANVDWCDTRDLQEYKLDWAAHIGAELEDQRTLVARLDDRIVGMVCVDGPGVGLGAPDAANLHGMHVDPDMRGGGIGQRVMAAALEHMAARSYADTDLGCLEANTYAFNFYKRFGWDPIIHHKVAVHGWTYIMRFRTA
jgi:ribosomal protein S18 acetylase RimI-like enzyme